MKKLVKETESKTATVIEKESNELRKEIAMRTLDARSNPQKDSNDLFKKKKKLAVLLTLLNQKKTEDRLKKAVK